MDRAISCGMAGRRCSDVNMDVSTYLRTITRELAYGNCVQKHAQRQVKMEEKKNDGDFDSSRTTKGRRWISCVLDVLEICIKAKDARVPPRSSKLKMFCYVS